MQRTIDSYNISSKGGNEMKYTVNVSVMFCPKEGMSQISPKEVYFNGIKMK